MHGGFADSSEESADEKVDSQLLARPGPQGRPSSNDRVSAHQRGCAERTGADDFDLSAREDSAVFERNPWSIAKLNAQSRQRNHMPLEVPVRSPINTSLPQQQRTKRVADANGTQDQASLGSRKGISRPTQQESRKPKAATVSGTKHLPKAFPIVKAFQNCKDAPKHRNETPLQAFKAASQSGPISRPSQHNSVCSPTYPQIPCRSPLMHSDALFTRPSPQVIRTSEPSHE
jgi:hypothetical protein